MTGWKTLSDRHGKSWAKGIFRINTLSSVALGFCISLTLLAHAQQKGQPATAGSLDGRSAQGSLAVTAIVVPSVGVLIGPNGEQVLVVANAPAGDNKSVLTPVRTLPPDPTQPIHEQPVDEKRARK
jgi:hypothetical protein